MADPKSPNDELEIEPAVAEEVELPDTEGGRTDGDKKAAKPEAEVEAVEEDAPRSREQGDEGETEAEHKRRGRSAKARREAQRRREAAKDAELAELRRAVAELKTGQTQIADSQRSRDIATLTSNRDAALQRVNSYEELINQATVEGKPAGSLVKAMLKDQAEAAQYDQAIAWLKNQPQQTNGAGNGADKVAPERDEPAPKQDPATKILRDAFLEEHDWIDTDPNTDDADSARMQAIADQLAEEGIPSGAPRYWRELKQRGAKALPHRFNGGDMEDAPRRSGPPISARRDSNANPVNGKTVKLPAEMVQMMKDTGQWDDPKRRAKIAAEYATLHRAQQTAGAR